jgi:DNA-binding transcriptional ArsR family regulator
MSLCSRRLRLLGIFMDETLDNVWKALSDPTRRRILDMLRDGPLTTGQIVEAFPELSRFGVMKHIDVLKDAHLVLVRAEGRQRFNSLNPIPIRMIYERWVSQFEDLWATNLLQIMRRAEQDEHSGKSQRK